MEVKHVRGQSLKNEVILSIPVNLWGHEWRVTAGSGYVNIQRRSFAKGGKYRIMMRILPSQWAEIVKEKLAGKEPVEQAKELHNYTKGVKTKWTN